MAGGLEVAVGVEREAIHLSIEHRAPAREMLVLVPSDQGRQAAAGQARGAETAPALPDFVVPMRVGQAVAVRLGRGQQGAIGDKLQRPAPGPHAPDNPHAGHDVHDQRNGGRTGTVVVGFRRAPWHCRLLRFFVRHASGRAARPSCHGDDDE